MPLLCTFTANADFSEPTPFTVTFTSGTSFAGGTMTAMISAVNDAIVEGDEDFTVAIASTSLTVTVGTPSSVTLTITDDDRKSKAVQCRCSVE